MLDHESDKVESESGDEIHINIKGNTVVVTKLLFQKQRREKYQSFTVAINLKRRNLTLTKKREKRQHSLRVTVMSFQLVNLNTNKSSAKKTQKVT